MNKENKIGGEKMNKQEFAELLVLLGSEIMENKLTPEEAIRDILSNGMSFFENAMEEDGFNVPKFQIK